MANVNNGSASEVVFKLDSSGTQIFAKYYQGLTSNQRGFVVDNNEASMYLVDFGGTPDCRILRADATNGIVISMFEE
jgi:hypothetical protein